MSSLKINIEKKLGQYGLEAWTNQIANYVGIFTLIGNKNQ